MTSMQMQSRANLPGDHSYGMRSGCFDSLTDTFGDGFQRQNELRDDVAFDGTASAGRLIAEQRKTGARPDDFDLGNSHTEHVRHGGQLDNDRFCCISGRHVMMLPQSPSLAAGEHLPDDSLSQSCVAKQNPNWLSHKPSRSTVPDCTSSQQFDSNPPRLPAETSDGVKAGAFFYSKNSPTAAANRIPNAITPAIVQSISIGSRSFFGSFIFNSLNHSRGSRSNGCPRIV